MGTLWVKIGAIFGFLVPKKALKKFCENSKGNISGNEKFQFSIVFDGFDDQEWARVETKIEF